MTDLPPVTVITPSLNQAGYLHRCLKSVRDQRYPRLEHIVLDGGSTDGTVRMLHEFDGPVTWFSERDRGQAAAVNRGLALARGEIIGWLNSDDFYVPGAVATAVSFLLDHPDADMVYGRALLVDEDDETVRPYPTFPLTRDDLKRKCYICQPSVFLRRSVVERVGPLNESLHLCLDYEWWLRMSRRVNMQHCRDVLAASRLHPTAKTVSRRLRALVEAGYLMRHHFGRATWRWSAKWIVHRRRLDRHRSPLSPAAWITALASARRYRRRFDARRPASPYGRRLLDTLRRAESESEP